MRGCRVRLGPQESRGTWGGGLLLPSRHEPGQPAGGRHRDGRGRVARGGVPEQDNGCSSSVAASEADFGAVTSESRVWETQLLTSAPWGAGGGPLRPAGTLASTPSPASALAPCTPSTRPGALVPLSAPLWDPVPAADTWAKRRLRPEGGH